MGTGYDIFLDNNKIGVTAFEKADAPMGVVFGKINFINIGSGYSFFKEYCSKNKIDVNDYPEDRVILTRDIPALRVFNSSGIEVKGLGCSVSGMDSDIFEICIEGIPYPFYEDEFPHHVETYNNMFNK